MKKRWNEADTGSRIETDMFTYSTSMLIHTQRALLHKHCQTLLHRRFHTEKFLHPNALKHNDSLCKTLRRKTYTKSLRNAYTRLWQKALRAKPSSSSSSIVQILSCLKQKTLRTWLERELSQCSWQLMLICDFAWAVCTVPVSPLNLASWTHNWPALATWLGNLISMSQPIDLKVHLSRFLPQLWKLALCQILSPTSPFKS